MRSKGLVQPAPAPRNGTGPVQPSPAPRNGTRPLQPSPPSRYGAPPKAPVRVADTRAEILGMITNIGASQRAAEPKRAPSPLAKPQAATSVLARLPGPISNDAQAVSLTELTALMQSVAYRLSCIEDRLGNQPKQLEALPPARSDSAPPSGTMFGGAIQGQMLSDMLQLVSANHLSGIFVIATEMGKCNLYIDEGKICHADSGVLTGEDAFFAAFASERGRYYFTETKDLPADKTVSAGTQFLVLEALRRMDERDA